MLILYIHSIRSAPDIWWYSFDPLIHPSAGVDFDYDLTASISIGYIVDDGILPIPVTAYC